MKASSCFRCRILTIGLPLLLLHGLFIESAGACGGIFCSQTPVLQASERIIFEIEGREVTAYVQLLYEGNDPNFAWIVPVPEVPEVEVGIGQEMFDALDQQTQPRFITSDGVSVEGASAPSVARGCGGGFGGGTFGEPRLRAEFIATPQVNVWQKEQVGPYDVATLSARSAEDLNDWLRINSYQVIPGSEPIVQSYLDAGLKLLALKLSPSRTASLIEPIKLSYTDSAGCATIPIRLTAIAATPALEIVAWVFGSARAVPQNYAEVEIDPSVLAVPSDYRAALARAVDEQAGGRGFVTEYARPTADLSARGDPTLELLLRRHTYVTRVRTELDPEEMTVDPDFATDPTRNEDVSNQIVLGAGEMKLSAGPMLLLLALTMRLRRNGKRS